MNYTLLSQITFFFAVINLLIYWIDLFFFNKSIFESKKKPSLNLVKQNVLPSVLNNAKAKNSFQANVKLFFISFYEKMIKNSFTDKALMILTMQVIKLLTSSGLFFSLLALLVFRFLKVSHFPLSNFYEALIFLTWCLSVLNLSTIEAKVKKSILFSDQAIFISQEKKIYGAILAPCILFILTFAQWYLSSEFSSLVPALKSNWLIMHVTIMIASYTTFISGGLISLILLIQIFFFPFKNFQLKSTEIYQYALIDRNYLKNQKNLNSKIQTFSNEIQSFTQLTEEKLQRQLKKKQFYLTLDNLNYRLFALGFPLFTLGLLSGAVWANSAWGSYWSWDIKEVGSFIQWLFVAFYLHCRYKNYITLSHIISFLALLVLFFNFFGISLGIFGSSLHAYS